MLSILIPIFNFDVRPLVGELHRQCEALGLGFEILCFDDGSTPEFKQLNKQLWKLPNLIYREMPKNLGRSAIRNALGKAARFEYLLFMDCDSQVVSPNFIQNYMDSLAPDRLVYGGRCYDKEPPNDPALLFHWEYGRQREQSTAAERSRSPYHSFMTNNFLIPRSIFQDIRFDECLRQYGHEDTLFGLELAKRGIPIWHIDNPLAHIGLEPMGVFLEKTRQGIENLLLLEAQGKPIETRLLNTFSSLRRWRMNAILGKLGRLICPFIVWQLRSHKPSMRLFDLYKLLLICGIESRN